MQRNFGTTLGSLYPVVSPFADAARRAVVDGPRGVRGVRLDLVLSRLARRQQAFPAEIAAYLALEVCDQLLTTPSAIEPIDIMVYADGRVEVSPSGPASAPECAMRVHNIFRALGGVDRHPASLREMGSLDATSEIRSLPQLRENLLTALFPLDREDCRRALAQRLAVLGAVRRTDPPTRPTVAARRRPDADPHKSVIAPKFVPEPSLSASLSTSASLADIDDAYDDSSTVSLRLPAPSLDPSRWQPPLLETAPALGRFQRYELLGQVAVGGMARVFLARERPAPGICRLVALKRLLPELTDDADSATMFEDEARVTARLSHPNVCHVYEYGDWNGAPYLALEWVHGMTLAELVLRAEDHGGIPVALATRIATDVAAALAYAHDATDSQGRPLSIVHRDVSPQNIMIRFDGVVKLLDFGVAKATSQVAKTLAGTVKGKFAYMSPEQCLGRPIDGRSDVFALGCCLYELITGRAAFRRENPYHSLRAVLREEPADIRHYRPDAPEELALVVAEAMEKRRARRPLSATFVTELQRCLVDHGDAVTERDVARFVHSLYAPGEDAMTLGPVPADLCEPIGDPAFYPAGATSAGVLRRDPSRAISTGRGRGWEPRLGVAAGVLAGALLTAGVAAGVAWLARSPEPAAAEMVPADAAEERPQPAAPTPEPPVVATPAHVQPPPPPASDMSFRAAIVREPAPTREYDDDYDEDYDDEYDRDDRDEVSTSMRDREMARRDGSRMERDPSDREEPPREMASASLSPREDVSGGRLLRERAGEPAPAIERRSPWGDDADDAEDDFDPADDPSDLDGLRRILQPERQEPTARGDAPTPSPPALASPLP